MGELNDLRVGESALVRACRHSALRSTLTAALLYNEHLKLLKAPEEVLEVAKRIYRPQDL